MNCGIPFYLILSLSIFALSLKAENLKCGNRFSLILIDEGSRKLKCL